MLGKMVKLGLFEEVAFTQWSKTSRMNYTKNRRNRALRRWKSSCKDLEAGQLGHTKNKKKRGVERKWRNDLWWEGPLFLCCKWKESWHTKAGFCGFGGGRVREFSLTFSNLKVSNFSMTGEPRSLLKLGMEKGVWRFEEREGLSESSEGVGMWVYWRNIVGVLGCSEG